VVGPRSVQTKDYRKDRNLTTCELRVSGITINLCLLYFVFAPLRAKIGWLRIRIMRYLPPIVVSVS
jgi:hypothetical protein